MYKDEVINIFDIKINKINGDVDYKIHVSKVEDFEDGIKINRFSEVEGKIITEKIKKCYYEVLEYTKKKLIIEKFLGQVIDIRIEDGE